MYASIRLAGAVLAIAGLFACGGGNGGATNAKQTTHAPTSAAQIAARLLTASDIGKGWKAGAPINEQDLAAFAQLPCAGAKIDAVVAKRLTAVTGAQFEPTDASYKHVIELVTSGNSAQLGSDLEALVAAVGTCSAASTGEVVVKQLEIPALGDQRAAYSATQRPSAASPTVVAMRAGYVRHGTVAVFVGFLDFQASAQGKSTVPDETFVRVLTTAVNRLST